MGDTGKTILSLCDFSGNWCRPYREAGYRIIQIDVKPGDDITVGDVRLLQKPGEQIHGILAAPPCTVFASSGARWPRSDDDMREGLAVVDACLRIVYACRPEWWALENPVGKLVRYLGKPTMYFHPFEFGDAYAKKTCLWGEFAEPEKTLVEPVQVCEQGSWIQQLGGKSERTKMLRSMTPMGFAKAFFEANK